MYILLRKGKNNKIVGNPHWVHNYTTFVARPSFQVVVPAWVELAISLGAFDIGTLERKGGRWQIEASE